MGNVENGAQPQLSKRAQIANPFRAMVFGAMADEMIANGTDVVKLSLGEPDFGAPPAVRDAMREQYDGRPLPYTAAMGLPELRQAISDFYKERHHVDVDPKRIAITAGGSTALLLSAALTVVLTALALVLLDPMLAWINVTPAHHEVYTAAYTYCAIIFAGIGAQLFYNFICSFLRAMGDSVTPLLFLLFSTILNVGLDLLFILSFRWGVAGAAGATVLAQLISTIGCFVYAFVRYPVLRLHREDWRISLMDVKRHLVRGIPLGLQFSVLAVGIIVMQGGVVQFDMRDGVMVSNAAQNGFGAANKLNNLLMTPMNGLGAAMTSYTAQNMGAGQPERIKKGTLQALAMVSILAGISIAIGLGLSFGGSYLRIFLSVDKVTAETMRYGNTYLYVDLAMYLFLGFIFVVRNCVFFPHNDIIIG